MNVTNTYTTSSRHLNNFDLIRLFAATQVAIWHTKSQLYTNSEWLYFLTYFPGVPIFFFISGYLIYESYENITNNNTNNHLRIFFTNRFLRLYPALWLCFFLTLSSIYLSGYFNYIAIPITNFAIWVATSLTFFQFYTPDFLRGYGPHGTNGSLWTIVVEIQFYLLTPVIFVIFTRYKKIGIATFACFVAINIINTFFNTGTNIYEKLFGESFVPWIFMFICGAYLSTNKILQNKINAINIFIFFCLYVLSFYLSSLLNIGPHLGDSNTINVISFIFLACLIFKAANTHQQFSNNILGKNDISYGVYIYHMPIINLLVFNKFQDTPISFLFAMVITYAFAFLSWKFIERPALNLKKIALRRFN